MLQFQRGFSLLELMIAIALTSMIGVWSATTWVQHSEDIATEAMGRWLWTVKESVDQMLVRQADGLTGLLSSTGPQQAYQDVWRPTLAELIKAGHLASGFSLLPPLGYALSIRVLKPIGLCLTTGCKIEVLTIATPLDSNSGHAANVTRLGKMLAAFKGSGASVSPLLPSRVRGPQLDLPNPPMMDGPTLPIGSIVLHSFYDSSAQSSFLRQGEKRDVQLKSDLSVAGRLRAGQVQLAAVEIIGTPCQAAGALAQSSSGGVLVCQGGVWRSSSKSWGGFYIELIGHDCHSRFPVGFDRRNPLTGDCSCSPGFEEQLISIWTYPRDSYNDLHTYMCVNKE